MLRMRAEERRARLVVRHRLAPEHRASDACTVARSLVALHSTDPATVFLSIRARTRDLTTEDMERELYEDRTLVRMLGMRRTLFVVPRELVPVVQAACTRTIAARERQRLEAMIAASDLSADPTAWLRRALRTAERELEARGEAFTSDLTKGSGMLSKRIRAGAGTRWAITQTVGSRVLRQLAMEGRAARARPRGSWTNGQYRWTSFARWLGEDLERHEPRRAQAELVRRWLAAFGPASEQDLRWWTGWTARETRSALAAVPHAEVDLGVGTGYVLADDVEPVEAPPPCTALLPTLDSTTMGWKARDWYLGPHQKVLFDANGNAGPTVWWDGRVVGGWSQRPDGEIVFALLEDVGRDAIAAVEDEAERLAAFVGDARIAPGFLPPFQRKLAVSPNEVSRRGAGRSPSR